MKASAVAELFADAVRSARQARGMTQQDIADAVAVHRTTINQLEMGEHEPRLGLAVAVALVLDIDVMALGLVAS